MILKIEGKQHGHDNNWNSEEYERQLVRERPKFVPKKLEQIGKLSPEGRQEYENSKNQMTAKTTKLSYKQTLLSFVNNLNEIKDLKTQIKMWLESQL